MVVRRGVALQLGVHPLRPELAVVPHISRKGSGLIAPVPQKVCATGVPQRTESQRRPGLGATRAETMMSSARPDPEEGKMQCRPVEADAVRPPLVAVTLTEHVLLENSVDLPGLALCESTSLVAYNVNCVRFAEDYDVDYKHKGDFFPLPIGDPMQV